MYWVEELFYLFRRRWLDKNVMQSVNIKNVRFTLEQAKKALRLSRGIAVIFL